MEQQRRHINNRATWGRTIMSLGGLLVALMIFSTSSSFAQDPALQWALGLGSSGHENGMAIAVDASGNIYVSGFYSATMDFDPGIGTYNLSAVDTGTAFVAKYDSSRNLVWAFSLGGVGQGAPAGPTNAANAAVSIAVDAGGNVAVMGWFSGTTDFDPGAGTAIKTARVGTSDMFIARYNAAGQYLWSFTLAAGIESQYSKQNCIALDSQGNIVVGGQFAGTVDFNPGAGTYNLTSTNTAPYYSDIFVAKYTPSGSLAWAFKLGTKDWETVQALAVDKNDNIVVAGIFGLSTKTTMNFNPANGPKLNVTPPGRGSNYVAKYSSAGQVRWAFGIGNDSAMRTMGLTTDDSNNIVLTGYFQGTVDFNPSTATNYVTPQHLSNTSMFLAKYDSLGHYRWAFGTAMGWGSSVATDANGNVIVNGSFACSGDFDPGANTVTLSSYDTCQFNCFVARYTATDTYDFAFAVSGTDAAISPSYGMGVTLDVNGSMYVVGRFGASGGSSDFDPSAYTTSLTSVGGSDVFIAKYSDPVIPKRAVRMIASNGMSITPNPFTDEFILRFNRGSAPGRIQIIDMMGSVVESKEITGANDEITLGSELRSGTYIVQIMQGENRRTMRIQKVK